MSPRHRGGSEIHSRKNTLSRPLDDLHHITRTQASGDPEAFNPLVKKYHTRLYTHIKRRVKDAEIAKDLTQETRLRAFRAISSFRGDSAFYSWLYRIAENVCTDRFRRQKYNTEPLHLIDENRITETDPCPSRGVERSELREHLQKSLTALTPIRRRIFLLYYHHELPIKAIAAEIGRSEGTIKSHLRNARLQLQEFLIPYMENQHVPWLA